MVSIMPETEKPFLDSIPNRVDIANEHKRLGGKVAAVLPIHYPREMLRAFNIHPIEVWGPPGIDPTSGITHLQPYVCSLVRNALSFLEMGGMDVVDLILVPHACDSLQGLGSVLLDFSKPRQPVFPFYLPRGEGESSERFLVQEIAALFTRLEELTQISPTEEQLFEAVEIEEAADERVQDLLNGRTEMGLSDYDFYRLVRSREYLPVEMFLELTSQALTAYTGPAREGIRLLISGIVPEPMSLLQVISDFGGVIVADDLACSSRRAYPHGLDKDPFRRMAQRILGGPPDWNKGSPIEDRLRYLLQLADQSAAEGVIFHSVKFCEPELFDLPQLRNGLQDRDLPSVHLEVDLNDTPSSEMLTQIETFIETIL